MEKVLDNVRFTLKNDTEENWKKAVNFVPKKGEPIIYNKDAEHNYSRIKIGDGITKVSNLPFSDIDNVAKLEADNTFTGINSFSGETQFGPNAENCFNDDGSVYFNGDMNVNNFTAYNLVDFTFATSVEVPTPTANSQAATKKYVDEKSKTAEKLSTPRNIGVSGNAISTAVPFDGSKNINIPIAGLYNTALKWSDSGDTAGSITPIGTAIIPNFNANRIAFLPDDAIEVEYSTDGGNTWTNCTNHEANVNLTTLFNKTATSYSIGNKRAIGAKASINDKLRITFTAYRDNHTFVYCNIRKIFINVTTLGAIGSKVLIEKANIGTPNTFTTVKESRLEGWPAWNEINTTLLFGGGDYAPTQAKKLRFTFSIAGLDETYSSALAVFGMYFMGENCWASSSTLAVAGHMYRIDSDKSCTFPGDIKTTSNFVGNLLGNATNDGNGNNIVDTYLKKENNPIVVSDTEPTNSNVSIWVDIS